jgi:hypothetical protein
VRYYECGRKLGRTPSQKWSPHNQWNNSIWGGSKNKLGRGKGGDFFFVCLFFLGGGWRVGISERAIHSRWNQWVDNPLMLGHWTHDNSLNQKVGNTIFISFLVLFADVTCTQYHHNHHLIRFAQSSNVTINKGRQERSSTMMPFWAIIV